MVTLTQLRQEAMVGRDDFIVEGEPALYDAMNEAAHGKPAQGQTASDPQPAPGPLPSSYQPGSDQEGPRYREKEHQDLGHGTVIGHVVWDGEVPWPIGMGNPCFHHLSETETEH